MSVEYFLYTEVKVDNIWRCIDGYVYVPDNKENGDDRLELTTLFESYSRTYFSSTYDELRAMGSYIPYSELSEDLRNEYKDISRGYCFQYSINDDDESKFISVPASRFLESVPSGVENHGVYHQNDIEAFKSGEIDYLYDSIRNGDKDINAMSEEEKKCYKYYEWDYSGGWYANSKTIAEKLKNTFDKFRRVCDFDDSRIILICF